MSPHGYQSLDENGNYLDINEEWLDLLGYSREEVIGKSFGNFLEGEYKELFKGNFPKLKSVGEILGAEFCMVRKDGSTLMVNLDGPAGTRKDGSFQQIYCIIKDYNQTFICQVTQMISSCSTVCSTMTSTLSRNHSAQKDCCRKCERS